MSTLNNLLYERNLLYQQVNLKWSSYFYLRKLLGVLQSRRNGNFATKTLYSLAFFLVYLIDFVLGVALLIIIHANPVLREWLKDAISLYTITMLRWTKELITWIMGVPAGLKLNTPLDHFLGNRFVWILELWEYFYSDFISTSLTFILPAILISSCLGLTVTLTALHDFLKFLNLCLISFFIFASRIVSLQVSALKSLARLFMGKKWNILRKRVDSCNYDISQLLVGTILFTVLLFLLPTTGVYFIIFLLMRVIQFGLQLILRTLTVFINKVTIAMWRRLDMLTTDQPLTKLRLTVDIPKSGSMKAIEGDDLKEANVSIHWNGERYSIEDICKVIDAVNVDSLLKELNAKKSECNDRVYDHAMLSFVGKLPW